MLKQKYCIIKTDFNVEPSKCKITLDEDIIYDRSFNNKIIDDNFYDFIKTNFINEFNEYLITQKINIELFNSLISSFYFFDFVNSNYDKIIQKYIKSQNNILNVVYLDDLTVIIFTSKSYK